jgi:competence protein ComEC
VDLRTVPAAAAAWALAAWGVEADPRVVLAVAVLAVVVAGVLSPRRRAVALVAVAVAAVAASVAWRVGDVRASPVAELAEHRQRVTLEVQVSRDARTFAGAGGPGTVVGLLVLRVEDRAGRVHGVRDPVTAFLVDEHPDLLVGRRLVVEGRLGPPQDSRDTATLRIDRRTRGQGSAWWWSGSGRVRAGVRDAVDHAPPAPAALVPALVVGDDTALPEQVEEEFRRTGLTHLLAVSGTNLTIVLAMVLAVARAVRAPPRVLVLLGLLGVVGFVLLARPEPSVLRAAGMGVVGLAALGLGSRGGLRPLCVAVVGLLFLDPWLSRAAGFVLSVSATAGILLLAPPFARAFGRWMPRWAAVAVAVPLAAQAACTPTIVALSSEVSVVAVAANVLAAPAVAPATVLGLLAGLLDLLAPPLASLVGSGAAACAAWIVLVAHHAAALPGASLTWSHPWWLLLPVVPLVLWAGWRVATHPVLVVGLVLGLAVATVRPPSPGWPPRGWVMVACDVGQGDATVVRAGPGEAVVVDAGMEADDVDRCLRGLRVSRVPVLVLTHGDADHVGGRAGVTTGRTVGVVVLGRPGPSVARVPTRTLARGDRFSVGDVEADVLWPLPRPGLRADDDRLVDRNADSLVLRVVVRGVSLLLTGDVGEADQDRILRAGSALDADVLKVAHHGSADTSLRFTQAVSPQVATVSVGADNDYGHPTATALRMLDDVGAAVHRTDREGDVAVVLRDGRLAVVTRGGGQRSR